MRKSTFLLVAALLVGLGYELSSWVKAAHVKAQEPVTVASASRFQIVKAVSGPNSDWGIVFLDSVQGRAFRFVAGPTHDPELLEIPIRVCANDDCTKWNKVISGAELR